MRFNVYDLNASDTGLVYLCTVDVSPEEVSRAREHNSRDHAKRAAMSKALLSHPRVAFAYRADYDVLKPEHRSEE